MNLTLACLIFSCALLVAAKPTKFQQNIPTNFDARAKWPECPGIGQVSDQGDCAGAGWAIASADVASDHFCIQSQGKLSSLKLSALQLLQCLDIKLLSGDPFFGKSGPRSSICDVGHPFYAFAVSSHNGLVSGGPNNLTNGCKPYPFGSDTDVSTVPFKCVPSCDNHAYPVSFEADKHYVRFSGMVRIVPDFPGDDERVKDLMAWMVTNGTVATTMDVYESFLNLKGDQIYRQGPNDTKLLMEHHGVRVIGWGTEGGEDYWLAVNSFGNKWGNNGTFRIRRGHNDFHFENLFTY